MPRIMLALAVAFVLAFGASSALSQNGDDYFAAFVDPTGEVPAGTPDITGVTVSNDAKGVVTFTIRIANQPTLTPATSAKIIWDAKEFAWEEYWADHGIWVTNYPDNGPDFAYGLVNSRGGGLRIGLFDPWYSYSWNNGVLTVKLDGRLFVAFNLQRGSSGEPLASQLWPPTEFTFQVYVYAMSGYSYYSVDVTDRFSYEVKILRDLIVKSFSKSFSAPKAARPDKVLTVRMTTVRDDTGEVAAGNVACRAKIGKKLLPPWPPQVLSASVSSSAACAWLVPKTAKGKTVTGSITLTDSSGLHPVVESKAFSVKMK